MRALSLEDLKARLAKIEELEDTARRELRNLKGRQERIAELERDRDSLLEDHVGRMPEAPELFSIRTVTPSL